MKVIIAGGRDFTDYKLLKEKCDTILSQVKEDIWIVSGTASGADMLGEKYALERGYQIVYFAPNWRLYGRGAGHVRNREMAEYANSLIAFWDGKSPGTKNMINKAKEKGLKTRIINYYACSLAAAGYSSFLVVNVFPNELFVKPLVFVHFLFQAVNPKYVNQ